MLWFKFLWKLNNLQPFYWLFYGPQWLLCADQFHTLCFVWWFILKIFFRLAVRLWPMAHTGVGNVRACWPQWRRLSTLKQWQSDGRWSGPVELASWGGLAHWPPTLSSPQFHMLKGNQCSDTFAPRLQMLKLYAGTDLIPLWSTIMEHLQQC